MSLSFSTKAGTLKLLQGKLSSATIAPLVIFSVADWQKTNADCMRKVEDILGAGPWIVRSSCRREDNIETSNAGAFLSKLNVTKKSLESAINEIIKSFGKDCLDDEVLIQPMLKNVLRSGVAFSHDPNTCSPYRIISWSEGSDTTIVTGGIGGKTWQQAALSPVPPPDHLAPVFTLIEELLALFGEQPVDCEYAVTSNKNDDSLCLLQARPLLLNRKPESNEKQLERLKLIQKKIEKGVGTHPFLKGQRTVYGVMPDWNPAEIIGIRPKPLALSLYRELITDAIWAYQRHNYGYRNLRSFALMPHFFGLPYIDLRVSFNSFIPSDLEDKLADRLVDHYINRLLDEPTLHDKVEFEIVFSCYTLDLPDRLKHLDEVVFSNSNKKTISDSLRNLTNRIIHPQDGLLITDSSKLNILNERREIILSSKTNTLECIYWLLEDAKRYGTLPFAGLARAGFVAMQMLRSLVSVGIFSQKDHDAFIGSLTTISKQMVQDLSNIAPSIFLKKYGHLRPGTYDILSPRYDEKPDMYFEWNKRPSKTEQPVEPFALTPQQLRELHKLLKSHGLHTEPVELFDFLKAGIELRELAKFHFTNNLSDAIALISEYGNRLGFSREELAYCDISAFRELHMAALKPAEVIQHSIKMGQSRYKESLSLSLPPLILQTDDIWNFEHPIAEPNFISQQQVTAPVTTNIVKEALSGMIVCIPNADPGFDWLFSHKISGLITTWGGANSHMAIRAGELNLPAVIGAGKVLYQRWSNAKRLHIDCSERKVEVLV